MAQFINIEYPSQHGGVARLERSAKIVGKTIRSFNGARGTATLLLAASVSALIVVANELITTWTEGHLLAAWVALWAVGFAALALFAAPARAAAGSLLGFFKAWGERRRERIEDAKLWRAALDDARIMADLSRAMSQAGERDVRAYY